MEGLLRVASTFDKERSWHDSFLKLDEISGHLMCYKDVTQNERKWMLPMLSADISTPIPGAPSHGGISTDRANYCICIFTPSQVVYIALKDDALKKAWTNALLRVARDGPHDVKFSKNESGDDYVFMARVSEYRVVNKKAEYKIRCCARFLNKAYNRKTSTEWDVWHRYSHFVTLDSDVRRSLDLNGAVLPPRMIVQSFFGNPLDIQFLEDRRVGLDNYITKVCSITLAVDFFQPHANPSLKAFVEFDLHCKIEDTQYTKKEALSRQIADQQSSAKSKEKHSPAASPQKAATPSTSVDKSSPKSVDAKEVTEPTRRLSKAEKRKMKKARAKAEGTRAPELSDDPVEISISDAEEPTKPASPDRNNLLAQIQMGAKLKKVE